MTITIGFMNTNKVLIPKSLTRIQPQKKGIPRFYDLAKIWNPSWFQGNRKKKNYFEGWYVKLVSAGGGHIWSFIPGISLHSEDPHAFIQVINGHTGETWYFKFPPESFRYSRNGFYVQIGDNELSENHIRLNLQSPDARFAGEVTFSGQTPLKTTLLRPGIMGWYRYVPFMECYHGLVSMNHNLHGRLMINGEEKDFGHGRGYLEKDWGTSMPESWIWMQSNHFHTENTSFMLSVAKIPWLGSSFTGFLGFFLHQGKPHLFSTYNGAKITTLKREGDHLHLSIRHDDLILDVRGEKGEALTSGKNNNRGLKAPTQKQMNRVIHESLTATLRLTLRNKSANPAFEGKGRHAGLEMIGDTDSLKP